MKMSVLSETNDFSVYWCRKIFYCYFLVISTVGITKGYLDNQVRDNINNVFSLTSTSPKINRALWKALQCFHGNRNKNPYVMSTSSRKIMCITIKTGCCIQQKLLVKREIKVRVKKVQNIVLIWFLHIRFVLTHVYIPLGT